MIQYFTELLTLLVVIELFLYSKNCVNEPI
jgi:hypothetical protein